MKKILSFLIVAFFAANSLFADDISAEQALQIASRFAKVEATKRPSTHRALATATPKMAYSEKSKVVRKENVYVINFGNNQGFVVVSGESGTSDEILGYCDHGSFDYENCPIQLKDLLQHYTAAIDKLRQDPSLGVRRRVATAFPDYIGTIIVGPLLTTTWSQWGPYNLFCPTGCPTGCYPTALAQVMNYWKWPKVTRGTVNGDDFSGRTYDWDNMLDNYEQSYTQDSGFGEYTFYNDTQANAVAHLMADIGKAFGTGYQPVGSPTIFTYLPLIDNFGYEPSIKTVSSPTAAGLQSAMKAELDEKRPVLYCGAPASATGGDSHALVCDGYTDRDYFHFNYGWAGSYDGFYKNALMPRYQYAASIFTGVRPYDAEHQVIGGIEYGLLKDGKAEVLDYPQGEIGRENGEVTIPATVEDGNGNTYKVTRIRKQAFYNKGHFTKMTIGDNVEVIEPFAFIYSTIDEVVISDQLKEIPDEAFQTAGVSTLTIGASVERIGKKAFYLCPLSKVTCKSPAFVVDDNAFTHSWGSIDSGEWLGHITKIGKEAFAGCTFTGVPDFALLEEVGSRAFASTTFPGSEFFVPASLKHISPDAFDGSRLSYFTVKENHPYFRPSPYGAETLISKNGTSLIMTVPYPRRSPLGDGLTPFPESLVKMEPGCVRNGVRVIIPGTIIEMDGAYKDVTNLTSLTCLAVVPPTISDDTFNDQLFASDPALYVPQGTEALYRNAPGWRKFNRIFDEEDYVPMAPQGLQYNMVLNSTDEKTQQRINIPVNDIKSMEVSDDGQHYIIKRNGKEDLITSIAAIDSIAWMPGFVYENAEIFDINENNLTVEAQKCKVRFDPTVIDGDVQLCVRNSVLKPNVMEGVMSGFAIDLSLSDGTHNLTGTIDITIPVEDTSKEYRAAYFNEESGEWDPVYYEYDKSAGTVTISTNHLSVYGFFEVYDQLTSRGLISPIKEPQITRPLGAVTRKLLEVVSSDDPEFEMQWQVRNDMGFWQSVGLDVLYSAANGTLEVIKGYKPFAEEVDLAVESMGYLATALNVVDVARADLRGDDVGVAAGTLKTILGHYGGVAAKFIGTPVFTVSMATVAAIGIALEKFGTAVQQRKIDLYREAYRIYYTPSESKPILGSTISSYGDHWYRTSKDWFELFYTAFSKPEITQNRLDSYIEAEVRNYCDRFWEDGVAQAMCVHEAEARGLSSWFYPDENTRKTISDEFFAELMNGQLVSVIQSVRNHVRIDAFNMYSSYAKSLADLMNTKIGLRIRDKSCKEDEKSKYADHTIRFTYIPRDLADPENLQGTIDEHGSVNIGYFTHYALVVNDMPTRLTLIDPKGKEIADYPFEITKKKGKQIIDIDLATGGVDVEAPHLDGLELLYDPNHVVLPMTMSGFSYRYDNDGNLVKYDYTSSHPTEIKIPLDNSFNKKANFQAEIEKYLHRHEFITVDEYGNVKLGTDIVTKFEGNEAKAKFNIDVLCPFVEKSKEEFVKDFNNFYSEGGDATNWLNLLSGTIAHKIDGEVVITRSADSEGYDVTFTGSGTFSFNGKNVSLVENFNYPALEAGENQTITVDDITIADSDVEGKVELKYSIKLE